MRDAELTQLLMDWSSTFGRISIQNFNRFARTKGLSLLQWSVLMHLYHHQPLEVTAFTEVMQVSPAGASQMIERLVQEGMVERTSSAGDRRVREVHMTAAGRQLVETGIEAQRAWLQEMTAGLPAAQQAAVADVLTLLIARAVAWEARA